MRAAVNRWLARYGVAEIVGLATAMTGAWIMSTLTGSTVLTAYAGAIGENVGYYGFLMTRECATLSRTGTVLGVRTTAFVV